MGMSDDRPTAIELQAFLERHQMSQSELARRSGLGRRTIIRYLERGTDHADPYRVNALARLIRRLDKRQKGG